MMDQIQNNPELPVQFDDCHKVHFARKSWPCKLLCRLVRDTRLPLGLLCQNVHLEDLDKQANEQLFLLRFEQLANHCSVVCIKVDKTRAFDLDV